MVEVSAVVDISVIAVIFSVVCWEEVIDNVDVSEIVNGVVVEEPAVEIEAVIKVMVEVSLIVACWGEVDKRDVDISVITVDDCAVEKYIVESWALVKVFDDNLVTVTVDISVDGCEYVDEESDIVTDENVVECLLAEVSVVFWDSVNSDDVSVVCLEGVVGM